MSEKKSNVRKYMIYGAIAVVAIGFFVVRGNSERFAADERLQIEVTSPAARRSLTEAEVTVTGIVSDPAARVRIDGSVVEVSADGGFSREVALEYGSNRVSIVADGEGFRETSRSVSIPRAMVLEILEPVPDSVSTADGITVGGTISDAAAMISVAGIDVAVADDGSWSTPLRLYYPLTIIDVTATHENTDPITEQIRIRLD